ncbi:MAG: methylenetetrahydrofolate reductase C-terminal domain-containing protein [Thermodesulfobacteriota bacterium]|nr:methylenetetrahydrofolate reductase C-terminal domain-containing protein [Thermodesulfobacteriota bacterium]
MIRSITKQKPLAEVLELLGEMERVFIIGCGTCTTMAHTGGQAEVLAMKQKLVETGKVVTGFLVIPVACDNLTEEALQQNLPAMKESQSLLILTCAFGVQTINRFLDFPVIPALDTLFIGKEIGPGLFEEVCIQCGGCILGETGGICPVTSCHKGLLNGPCGGTNNGKCEIDRNKDCAWTLIYERLQKQGRLSAMRKFQSAKNYQVEPKPGKTLFELERSGS